MISSGQLKLKDYKDKIQQAQFQRQVPETPKSPKTSESMQCFCMSENQRNQDFQLGKMKA